MTLLGIVNDFMNGTGIHGLAFVVPGKSPTFERLVWTFFILGAIGYASYQLNEAVVCKSKGGFKSQKRLEDFYFSILNNPNH
jgi:hypothetical protein